MTTTTYYYDVDENGDEIAIDMPGELCDFCGKLDTICERGSLVEISTASPLMEEYGHSEDLHAHPECLEQAIQKYEEMLESWKESLKTYYEN